MFIQVYHQSFNSALSFMYATQYTISYTVCFSNPEDTKWDFVWQSTGISVKSEDKYRVVSGKIHHLNTWRPPGKSWIFRSLRPAEMYPTAHSRPTGTLESRWSWQQHTAWLAGADRSFRALTKFPNGLPLDDHSVWQRQINHTNNPRRRNGNLYSGSLRLVSMFGAAMFVFWSIQNEVRISGNPMMDAFFVWNSMKGSVKSYQMQTSSHCYTICIHLSICHGDLPRILVNKNCKVFYWNRDLRIQF